MSKTIKFSPAQNSAIHTHGKTLLVSAGAGSGKTTVLTQRILEQVKNGMDISDILVVTFTKAAASSLKDKLYSALLEASASDPANTRLSKNVYKISSARISTIHSFCLDLIKSNFEAVALPPSVRVADEAESTILLDECLEELIDKRFDEENGDFLKLCDAFTGEKNLSKFKDIVINIYKKYRSFPFWTDYIHVASEKAEQEYQKALKDGFMECKAGFELKAFLKEKICLYGSLLDKLYNEVSLCTHDQKNLTPLDNMSDWFSLFSSCLESKTISYDRIKAELDSYSPPNANTKGLSDLLSDKYKKVKSEIGEAIKTYKNHLSGDECSVIEDFKASVELCKMLNEFIVALDESFSKAKSSIGIVDYSDLEQYTLLLLGKKTPQGIVRTAFCQDKRESIKEIYIDEYQDVNPLQDMIFNLLSKQDNRFMVGDVKQSIYRFRNAKADIFLGYLSDFGDLGSERKENKIFLSENHRSTKNILSFVNMLFNELYTDENVGASYENERLIFPEDKVVENLPVTVSVFDDESEAAEDEAKYVANTIYDLVNTPDEDGNKYSYGDIALLLRSPSFASIPYEEEFDRLGIPYQAEKSRDFLLEPEVLLALSVLRIMDNKQNDISLAAALRSPVFKMTADDIYKLKRYYGYDSLYECVNRASNAHKRRMNGKKIYRADKPSSQVKRKRYHFMPHLRSIGSPPDKQLCKKCCEFCDMLAILVAPGRECPSSKLIWNMYMKTGLLSLVSAEENGKSRVRNLYSLYSYAIDFERSSFKGLSNFLHYISDIADSYGSDIESEEEKNDCVHIMSIHKSKGMEFPVCFVSSLGKKFNISDTTANYIVTDDGFSYCDLRTSDGLTEYVPLVKRIAASNEKKSMLKEELRCLYVALTRAMKRLYVTGVVSKINEGPFFEAVRFMDWIYPIVEEREEPFFECFVNPVVKAEQRDIAKTEIREAYPDDIYDKAVAFSYKNLASSLIPAKAAVSELRKGILEDDEYTKSVSKSEATKKPCFVNTADYASIGTSTHLFMQFADFNNVLSKGVNDEIDRLCRIKMISKEDAQNIDTASVMKFFSTDLFKRMFSSKKVFREKRFNLIENSEIISKESGENVMIQGVIDCFFLDEDGTYTVVDYKTDRVRGEKAEEELIKRHSIQLGYYRRAVQLITGCEVGKTYIYSFALGKETEVKL